MVELASFLHLPLRPNSHLSWIVKSQYAYLHFEAVLVSVKKRSKAHPDVIVVAVVGVGVKSVCC